VRRCGAPDPLFVKTPSSARVDQTMRVSLIFFKIHVYILQNDFDRQIYEEGATHFSNEQ
jgi:hypothetical protein